MFQYFKNEYKVILLSIFFLLLGLTIYVPGLFSIDDVTYLFMAHSFAKNHTFEIWNGFDEFKTAYFGIFEPVYYKNKMYGKYPHLYPIIAYPFYSSFGINGLFYINIISFVLTIFILYKFTNLLFSDNKLSLIVTCIYSFCTFSFEYAVGLWPHMLSVFLSLSAYLFFERSFLDDKRKNSFLILSGLLTGIAVGVRLQNIITAAIISLTILVFSKEKLKNLFSFLSGLLLVITSIGYINLNRFGSIDPFSYGHYKGKNIKYFLDYPGFLLLFAAFFLFFFLIFRFKNIILSTGKNFVKPVLTIISILVLITLLADPKWTFFNFLKNIYTNVIDLSFFFNKDLIHGQRADIAYFGHIKKSILQSCPFLILSFLSPWIMKKESFDKRKLFLLSASFFLQLMFISTFFFHGGFAFNVRYGLELLPFAVILCCYTIKDIKIKKSHITLAAIFFILIAAQNRLFSNQSLWKQLSILYLPLLLSVILISFFFLNAISKSNRAKYLLGLMALLSFTYGMTMTFTEDFLSSRNIRKGHQNITDELSKIIRNDSLIIMEIDKTVDIAAIMAVKKVRIASKGKQYKDLVNFYLKKQIPVYLISNKKDNLKIEKDYRNYYINNVPAENFLLYEIVGLKNPMQS